MARRSSGFNKQPSPYPALYFHGIRTFQTISSLIVAAIMFFFIYHLKHDHFNIPWTFFFLQGAALLTLINLTLTTILYCCRNLSPFYGVISNAILSILWIVGFGLLASAMRNTITDVCDASSWGNDVGIMVCQVYKTLFSFAAIGMVSTMAAFALDIIVRKRQLARGKYIPANPIKMSDNPRASSEWEVPIRPQEYQSQGRRQDQYRQEHAYAVPSDQQHPYDTSYHH